MSPEEVLLLSAGAAALMPELTAPLTDWFEANARSLPWRDDPTPYHVWVSEIMLQQTRVEAVKGYYDRFLKALPTPQHLAEAEEDTLLKLWEGLGYYNRVRNLQKAARVLVENHHGRLPASYGELLSLPGIGDYTAGAIASIAFGIPVPAVDGNVLRVLSRILCSYADVSLPAVKQAWRQMLPAAIPTSRPGDFNQALMELGATVCLPNGAPLCTGCPVRHLCLSLQNGCQSDLPLKAPKKARQIQDRTIVLILAGGKVLLFRRDRGLLGGMYEPLNLEGHLLPDQVREQVQAMGGGCNSLIPLRDSKHIFSHIEWRMRGILVYSDPFPAPESADWKDRRQLVTETALPGAFRAYIPDLLKLLADAEA